MLQRISALLLSFITLASVTVNAADLDFSPIQNNIQNIFYGKDDVVLLDADRMYLYDLSSGKVLAETARENFGQPRYQPCGSGYAAIGGLKNSMQGKIVFYDDSLKKESELSFSEITGMAQPPFSENYAVSPVGKLIAYCDGNKLFIYDPAAKSRTCILDGDTANAGMMHIAQVSYSQDGRTLFLLTGAENGMEQSLPACGKISVNGGGLVHQKAAGFTPYEISASYDSFALFGEDDSARTGKIAFMDAKTGAIRLIPLATTQERAAFGSDNGKFFATSSLDKSSCTIRVYESATGKKVAEQTIPDGGNPLYVARNPAVRILDGSKTCIVLMGNRQDDLKTMAARFSF